MPWTLEANWKVAVENYLECYHCPVAHPGLAKAIDVGADALRARGVPRTSPSSAARRARPSPEWMHAGEVTPRAVPLAVAERDASTSTPARRTSRSTSGARTAPGRTLGFTDYFFGPEVPDAMVEEMLAFSLQVGREDVALVEAVQRGMASGAVATGRLMPESERLVAHFQRLVVDALRG